MRTIHGSHAPMLWEILIDSKRKGNKRSRRTRSRVMMSRFPSRCLTLTTMIRMKQDLLYQRTKYRTTFWQPGHKQYKPLSLSHFLYHWIPRRYIIICSPLCPCPHSPSKSAARGKSLAIVRGVGYAAVG